MCPHGGELALGFAALGVGIICADGENFLLGFAALGVRRNVLTQCKIKPSILVAFFLLISDLNL